MLSPEEKVAERSVAEKLEVRNILLSKRVFIAVEKRLTKRLYFLAKRENLLPKTGKGFPQRPFSLITNFWGKIKGKYKIIPMYFGYLILDRSKNYILIF